MNFEQALLYGVYGFVVFMGFALSALVVLLLVSALGRFVTWAAGRSEDDDE